MCVGKPLGVSIFDDAKSQRQYRSICHDFIGCLIQVLHLQGKGRVQAICQLPLLGTLTRYYPRGFQTLAFSKDPTSTPSLFSLYLAQMLTPVFTLIKERIESTVGESTTTCRSRAWPKSSPLAFVGTYVTVCSSVSISRLKLTKRVQRSLTTTSSRCRARSTTPPLRKHLQRTTRRYSH
ncbi:hypothetical protein BDY19DRAFT_547904 [Irpex rosettiformis]|uniref:Uncharacterized protein n=1 Tax=Irpex rosettiformis TaxID=378272 RepID=A0ACB8TQA7_9APHY|nr:hypothetical protein BDY19DRAFT_547904 [Irpex rosettiformis]